MTFYFEKYMCIIIETNEIEKYRHEFFFKL